MVQAVDLAKKPDLMRWLHLLVLGTLAVAVLVLLVASWRLLTDYQPRPLGDPRLADGYRTATRTLIAVGTVLVVLRATIWRQPGRRGAIPLGLAVGGTLLVGISTFTLDELLWDQLGLWAVTAGADIAGVLAAAFDDQVRFVFVDGHEVSPSAYTRVLVLHSFLTLAGTAAIAVSALWPVRAMRTSELEPVRA
jgi:hypothetical protein